MPKTLSEKTDLILIKINDISDYVGQKILIVKAEMNGLLFVKRRTSKGDFFSEDDLNSQRVFMLNYLQERGYIEFDFSKQPTEDSFMISLSTQGYERIDRLEKNNSDGKQALVAMSFAEGTERLRESIRKGISLAGYVAVFIDEVEHNEFITPELLSYIRRSRFIVADLSHQNNGAYFEEGYAMGLGKPVIQLCKKGVNLHFDIAQKNTIMWESESDIPVRLLNRIKATIE